MSAEKANRKKPGQLEKAKPIEKSPPAPAGQLVTSAEKDFPVVALGASAGGLEAFTQFLKAVPEKSGIAFVLVQHLDPSHPSSLVELLSRGSPIPIREAQEGDLVQVDQAYVIPPGKAMSIRNRTLILEDQQEHPGLTHSINLFFHSLAEDIKERAVGVILSGTGSDGTEGARAIKAKEGLVIAQDPASARYDGMPRSVIDAGAADFVLAPGAMPGSLIDYLRQSVYKREQTRQSLKKDDVNLKNILSLVKTRTGRDFSGYKISSITRRIEHRMAVNAVESPAKYLKMLQENPSEVGSLMKDFLIQVTSFFRDQEAFAALKQALCRIIKDKPAGSALRAWIPACSTGEEAYSVAMVMLECVEESGQSYEVQVFGTDLDAAAIAAARAGAYPATIAQEVSSERLLKFFNKDDSSYQLKKIVRESVIFAIHDLVTDPPYSRMDLVSVRNLLIYFDAELQKKVLPVLHYSLNEGGLLFLGTSETIGEFNDLFRTLNSTWRIYQALGKKRTLPPSFAAQLAHTPIPVKLADTWAPSKSTVDPMLFLEALPPSVLIDHNSHVLYTHGDTSKYLRISEGKMSSKILDMAKSDLVGPLATLIHDASETQNEVISENLHGKHRSGSQPVKISVRPLSTMEGQMIITFQDMPLPKSRKLKESPVDEVQHRDLEEKLRHTQDTLRGTIEELKTANEELRSANEEYMSTNEELKSANEELETAREELQSVNEELTTLNNESQKKNEDLNNLNNDMQNLLNATGVATIFLDEKLRIRRFTPAAAQLFKFIASDIGRPLENISSPLKENLLLKLARKELENLIPVELEVPSADGKWYSLRILPYRTADNNIAGLVVSLVDISRIKTSLQYAEDIINSLREPLVVLDEKLKVISASRAFYQIFQVQPKGTEGQLIYELGNRQWNIPELRKVLQEVLKKDSVVEGYRVEHDFPGIGLRVMLLNARRIHAGKEANRNILLAIEDVTNSSPGKTFSEKREAPRSK